MLESLSRSKTYTSAVGGNVWLRLNRGERRRLEPGDKISLLDASQYSGERHRQTKWTFVDFGGAPEQDDDQEFSTFSSFSPASGDEEGGGRTLRLPIDGSDKDGAEGTLLKAIPEGGGDSEPESSESDGGYSEDPSHVPSEDEHQEIASGNASDSSNEYSLESVS